MGKNTLSKPVKTALHLKWVSCGPHRIGSSFFIQSDNLCLLTGMFGLLMFKVLCWPKSSFGFLTNPIISMNMGGLKPSTLAIFYLVRLFLFLPPFLPYVSLIEHFL